ncbi:MAG: hypothetical protein ACUVSS_00495 [Anaerolineae bacterium]
MKRTCGWLMLLLLAAFALRLYRLDAQDIWWDEARNLDVASRPLAQIATAGELDIHPPLYFYLLHGWWRLTAHGSTPSGQDAFAVRFLSLWFGVLFVALMYALGRRVGGFWAGLAAALGAAFLPFLLGEAQETRMYTVTLVWLAAAGLAVLQGARVRGQASGDRGRESGGRGQVNNGTPVWSRGFSRSVSLTTQPAEASIPEHCGTANKQGRLVPWLLFALFSALALLTHYAAVFALIALWGWAGLWALADGCAGLWPRLRTVLLAGLVTALLCLPGLPVALRQIPAYRNPNLVVPSLSGYLAELARVYSLGEHMDLAAAQPWMMALAALLIGGWLVGMANQRIGESANHDAPRVAPFAIRLSPFVIRHSSPAIRHLLFVLLWCLLPLAVYYLVIMDRSTFATRYIAGALPGWLLLAGLAVAGWARLGRVGGVAASLTLAVILAPGLIGDLTDPRFFREDTRGLVAWLRQETDPGRDIILVDQRYPFGLYWPRWNNSAGGVPPAEPADLAPAQYLFVDINTVADRLAALVHGHERAFLVRWFESDTDPRGAATWVLEKFGTPLGERALRGYTVTWYAVSPEAQFELAPTLDGAAAEFGDQIRLVEYAFGGRGPGITSTVAETRAPLAPADQPIWVVARWARLAGAVEPGKALPRGLKTTVVLEDADGTVVGRDDRPILNDRHLPPREWSETDRPLGVYLVRAAPAMPPGTYTVKLAVYDPVTLAQLPASGAAARGTFVTLGQVTLARPTQPTDVAQLPIDAPLTLAWGGVRLLGRGPLPAQISPGDRLSFDLFWQAEQDSLPELRVQLTLRPAEPGGAAAAQWEAPPVKGHPTGAWQAGDVVRGRQQLSLKPDMLAGDYQLTLRLADVAGTAISPPTTLGHVTVAGRPHVFEPPTQMGQHAGARFGDLATLLGYDLTPPAARSDALQVTLYWRAEAASDAPYAGSVQLLDAGGVLRAQRDQQPGDGAFPTTGWVPGEVLTDVYRVALPADLPTGSYAVIVKLYDAATGLPLSVMAAGAASADEFLRLATIQIP